MEKKLVKIRHFIFSIVNIYIYLFKLCFDLIIL